MCGSGSDAGGIGGKEASQLLASEHHRQRNCHRDSTGFPLALELALSRAEGMEDFLSSLAAVTGQCIVAGA